MRGWGYIVLTMDKNAPALEEQQKIMQTYGKSHGVTVEDFYTEQDVLLQTPFQERKEAARLLAGVHPGDTIFCMKSAWVFGSAKEGVRLIQMLKKASVGFYCIDLNENISLPTERKLVVSEGGASLILAVLMALEASETSRHGELIKATKRHQKKEGKYLGGPVPFGWRVQGDYLVQDSNQQNIINDIIALRSDRWSYRDIASKLLERYNVKLSHEGIRKIVAGNPLKKEAEKNRGPGGGER